MENQYKDDVNTDEKFGGDNEPGRITYTSPGTQETTIMKGTEEEKDVLNRLESSLFTESKFWDAPRNGMCDYLTYIGANIRKNGVYYFRMVEAWNFLFSFIVKYKEVINPMSKKIKGFCKDRYNKDKVLNAIDDAITMGLFYPQHFFKYFGHFLYYRRSSIKKALERNRRLKESIQKLTHNINDVD